MFKTILAFTVACLAVSANAEQPNRPKRIEAQVPFDVKVFDTLRARIAPLACSVTGSIACGVTRTGLGSSCNDGEYYVDFYSFQATAGQTLAASATTSSSTPIVVTIQDGVSGSIRAVNYGTGSATTTFGFQSGGTYYIGIGYLARYFAAPYTATFSCQTSTGTCRSSGRLPRSVVVGSSLGSADAACSERGTAYYKLFEITGVADTPVRITVSGASFPPYVEAATDDDNVATFRNSDALDPYLIFYPTRSGRQWIWVGNDANPTGGGTFSIRVDDEPLEPCRRRAARH